MISNYITDLNLIVEVSTLIFLSAYIFRQLFAQNLTQNYTEELRHSLNMVGVGSLISLPKRSLQSQQL
jgi:hypothetical protein